MAPRLPVCSGRHVVRALLSNGYKLVRINGSHHILRYESPPGRAVTVPVHGAKALKRATLASIVKQTGLTIEEFIALL